jgi:hypothetical protein
MVWNLYQVRLYSQDVGHHYDVIWEFHDYYALITSYALGKAFIPNIHYKLCTIVNKCHSWCLKQQGQHHKVALVFVLWATELTCPLTLSFTHCCQDVALWNGIGSYHYAQTPCATINGARKFVVNRLIDNNSTSDNMDLTSWLMHQLVMSITLMKSGKKMLHWRNLKLTMNIS